MATFDAAVAELAERRNCSIGAARTLAERLVENAVKEALRGSVRFDLLPTSALEDHARQRFQARQRAGEGAA